MSYDLFRSFFVSMQYSMQNEKGIQKKKTRGVW